MNGMSAIREHMEVVGADGVHVGTVDKVEGGRIKLTKADSGAQVEGGQGSHDGHHHYISTGLVAGVEGNQVRLSTTAANAVNFTQEEGEGSVDDVRVPGQQAGQQMGEEWGGGERAQVAPDGQDNVDDGHRGYGEEAGR